MRTRLPSMLLGITALLLAVPSSQAAVTVNDVMSTTDNNTLSNYTVDSAIPDPLLVVAVMYEASNSEGIADVTGVTFGGVALLLAEEHMVDGGTWDAYAGLWYLTNAVTDSAKDIVVTGEASAVTDVITAFVLSNIDQTDPVGVSGENSDSDPNPSDLLSVSLTLAQASSLVVAAIADGDESGDWSPGGDLNSPEIAVVDAVSAGLETAAGNGGAAGSSFDAQWELVSADPRRSVLVAVEFQHSPPTEPALSPTTVDEDLAAGTLVGTLSMPITSGDFTYSLPGGVLDNDSFALSGTTNSNLLTAAVFDFETKNSYDIRVVATEDGGASQVLTNTITVSVNDVNDLPTAANKTVTTAEDTSYVFSTNDFNFADEDDGDTFVQVKVTTLESAGALEYDSGTWGDVTDDQEITAADIGSSKLRFVPATNAYGTAYDSFEFKVHDGTAYSAAAYTMQVDVTYAADDPPVLIVNAEVGVGGTAVATLESKSEGTGLAYTISGGADRGLFDLTAGSLTKILAPVTAEVGTVYEVEVQATDSFGSNKVLIEVTVISGTSPGTVFRFK
ncbi:MAG: hypothetical protein HN700_18375 [Verrucomicrobia bacterium]|jgi:hypothetical protein|nr:hypothetical protein [Verrucomicrobiota bacterium]